MTPTQSIAAKKEQTLYRKKGNKYVPVNDPYAYDGLREGWWLVSVKEGSTTIRQCIWPDRAPLLAAAQEMEDKLVGIIRKVCEARPNKVELKPDEKRDLDWFIKKHGESFNTLHYPSFADNAREIVKTLLGDTYP